MFIVTEYACILGITVYIYIHPIVYSIHPSVFNSVFVPHQISLYNKLCLGQMAI